MCTRDVLLSARVAFAFHRILLHTWNTTHAHAINHPHARHWHTSRTPHFVKSNVLEPDSVCFTTKLMGVRSFDMHVTEYLVTS